MKQAEFIRALNSWGHDRVPFFFMVDFEQEKHFASPIAELNQDEILFDFQGFTNTRAPLQSYTVVLKKFPMPFPEYQDRFEKVSWHLHRGDTYLVNLTIRTAIEANLTLKELFFVARAKYKVWMADQFLFFSPESFIRISDDVIFSNPMKGTIDASIPNAREVILNDPKELSEHITIVDLIRNDMSLVAEQVEVKTFRYIDELVTQDKTLLQVSSEIAGKLKGDYWSSVGNILTTLLPAGSISGAPKAKTCEIISEAEHVKRGYYSGVCGYFDGVKLDSGVMIRFIELDGGKLYYRSGGGITTQSDAMKEYEEAIGKIYVPVN